MTFTRIAAGYYKSKCGTFVIDRVKLDEGFRWNLVKAAQSEWGVDEWIETYPTLREAKDAARQFAIGM